MYDNCRLDFGIYHDSPWCSTVTAEDLEVINYSEDLEYYWEKVYGHEINYEMSCPIIVDLMEHFEYVLRLHFDKTLQLKRRIHNSCHVTLTFIYNGYM